MRIPTATSALRGLDSQLDRTKETSEKAARAMYTTARAGVTQVLDEDSTGFIELITASMS